MSENFRYQLLIILAAAVIFLPNLGRPGLWDMDEALYSTCAREMLQRNDWIVPWFNDQMFPEKPPLMFWGMIAGFKLFGINEFGARFFSVVFAVGTGIIAFHLGRILFDLRTGFWAGLITVSSIIFTISARAATCDASLTFFTAAAFLIFVVATKQIRPTGQQNPRLPLLHAVGMYVFIGLAVLTKGPVGLVLPVAAICLFLLCINGWKHFLKTIWQMRPLTAILVVVLVALPWYFEVGRRTDGEWLRQFFLEFNLRPFRQPILGHGDTSAFQQFLGVLASFAYYFYHIPAVLVGFFPWSVFLWPAAVLTVRGLRRNNATRDGYLLAVCWFATWFVFWSLCKTKLPHYLLPAYPALAILTARFVRYCTYESGSAISAIPAWWLRNAWITMIVVGLVMICIVPFIAFEYLPGEEFLALLGLIPLIGGLWCWWLQVKKRPAIFWFAVVTIVFLSATFGFSVLLVDRHQNGRPVAAAIYADAVQNQLYDKYDAQRLPIASYHFFRESMVYYTGCPIVRCNGEADAALEKLQNFVSDKRRCYIITTDRQESELKKCFPDKLECIFRMRRFMAPGEVLVLATK